MKYFFIHIKNKFVRIDIESISHVISVVHHVKIVTDNQVYIPHLSLKQLEAALPPERFTRVNRATLIALDKVISFDKEDVMLKNAKFSFSGKYRKIFESKVQIVLHRETKDTKRKDAATENKENLFVEGSWFMNEWKQSFFQGTFISPHHLIPANTGLFLLH